MQELSMMYRALCLCLIGFLGMSAGAFAQDPPQEDPYLWLEEIEGERATAWVAAQNQKTRARLTGDPRFAPVYEQLKAHFGGDENLPSSGSMKQNNGWIYHLNKNAEHPRGLLRRTTLKSYAANKPSWEPLFDVDAFAKEEGKSWVMQAFRMEFSPSGERILFKFSDGGGDYMILREFDIASKSLVADGFSAPMGLGRAVWVDDDTLLYAAALEKAEETMVGYPRVIRKWSRGEALKDAPIVFEGGPGSTIVVPTGFVSSTQRYALICEMISQTEASLYMLSDDDRLTKLDMPGGMAFYAQVGMIGLGGHWVAQMSDDWVVGDETFKTGQVVGVDLAKMIAQDGDAANSISVIYEPEEGENVGPGSITVTNSTLYLKVEAHVASRLLRARPKRPGRGWALSEIELPSAMGQVVLPWEPDVDASEFLVGFASFLVPPSLHLMTGRGRLREIRRTPGGEGLSDYVTERFFAVAEDGTQLPYFVVRAKDFDYEGAAPVLMFGYGSFGVTFGPSFEVPYIGPVHQFWLQNGGVFVSAHVRGGGEYGPAWHRAAMGANRQVSYNDMYAITEDLIRRKITAAGKVSPIGGSAGGLMAAVLATQRPELYGASIALVPVTDMLRYHKMYNKSAAAIDEFGDPETPEGRAAVLGYSPYHAIKADESYPEMLLMTSTRDERVHPGHSRKMAAKLIDQGHPVLFYETAEGGHALAVDSAGRAFNAAMQLIYLQQKLMDSVE